MHNSHGARPYPISAALAYIESLHGNQEKIVLAIEDKASGTHIGNVALQAIHPIYRTAELAILIGDAARQRKGVGTESCLLMLEHGFQRLNLHRISCGTFSGNFGMIRIAEKLRMKQEGRRRDAAYKNGAYVDVIEFGILKSEFIVSGM